VRLTTDAPISYIVAETGFPLHRTINLIFGQDDPVRDAIDDTCREFLDRTCDHWREWTRRLNVPFEWQSAVVRAAITLRLCAYEDTGGIVAAHTTSIPEAPGTSRNWDYRYCWLRDAFFVVQALNRLGATHMMESYIHYFTTIATHETGTLRPVQGIVPFTNLDERTTPALKGYLGYGPVRIGNQAAEQIQHDSYARREGVEGRVRARRRHLGISRQHAGPHLFGRFVLGRVRPARAHRACPWSRRTPAVLGVARRNHPRTIACRRVERKTRRADRRDRLARSRRQRAVVRRTRPAGA
jgi:hypothetical protein